MPGSDLSYILKLFSPISLVEMEEVTLMDRMETKYVFSSSRLKELLSRLPEYYKVLEMNEVRHFSYTTTYYDTPDFYLLNQQLRGKLNRHKLRYRCYETTGDTFLEIKKKTNKKRTVKWRIENNPDPCFNDMASTFLKEKFPYNIEDLKPALINVFRRITLVGMSMKERITLDTDLSFRVPDGNIAELPYLAIAEVKHERHNGNSPFCLMMKENGIRPNSISKYSVGSSLTRNLLRTNAIKPNLLLINKIEHEYAKLA